MNNEMSQILQAINEMRQEFSERCDKWDAQSAIVKNEQIEISNDSSESVKKDSKSENRYAEQIEAMRRTIAGNQIRFNLVLSELYQNRSEIYSLKFEVGKLAEQFYLLEKTFKKST